LTKPI